MPAPSPDGRYLAYTKEGNWWIYDVQKDTHQNITTNISARFFNRNNSKPIRDKSYGIAGWSEDGKSVVLYDEFDLWLVDIKGSKSRRLTHGRESRITFRINPMLYGKQIPLPQIQQAKLGLDLKHGLLLKANDRLKGYSGFYKWTPGQGEQRLVWEYKKVDQVIQSKGGKYIYVEQKYDLSPQIMIKDGEGKSRVITPTNEHQKHFAWGNAQLLKYQYENTELSGVLYYPPG